MISVKVSKQKEIIQLELKARKTLDGNIMIFDHQDIDIVIYDRQYSPFLFSQDEAKYVPEAFR